MERTLRSYLVPSLGFLLILQAHLVAVIWYWPEFEDNLAQIKGLLPFESLRKTIDDIAARGVGAYIHFQHFVKFANILGTVAAVLFSCSAVAGEAHRGTLEIWLARPISRRRLLVERWAVGALALCAPIFASTATIPWLLDRMVDEDLALGPLLLSAVHQSALLLVVYSLSFLLSTRSSQPLRIALVLLFLALFQGVLYLVQGIGEWSYYRLADLQDHWDILNRGRLDLPLVGSLLAASGVLLLLAERSFQRRLP